MTCCGRPRLTLGGEPDFAPSSETPGGYVGQAAFNLSRDPSHDRAKSLGAARRHAAGGSRERLNAWITRAVFYRQDKTEILKGVAASENVRGSRLPTHAESGKPNAPITRVQLRTVKSGLPDVASRSFRRRGEVWLPSRCWANSLRLLFYELFEIDEIVAGGLGKRCRFNGRPQLYCDFRSILVERLEHDNTLRKLVAICLPRYSPLRNS